MKSIVRLTESDLRRIVKRVIRESEYRAKFGDTDYWIDQKGNHIYYDKDLENTGYYDLEYDPFTEVEDYEDIPDDIRERLFPENKYGRTFYDKYKEMHGNFKYSRMKDQFGE